jgi:hypothetical protein
MLLISSAAREAELVSVSFSATTQHRRQGPDGNYVHRPSSRDAYSVKPASRSAAVIWSRKRL